MNKSVITYVLSFGLAVGLFQNCTRQQFASLSSTDGSQGATSFDPGPGGPTGPADSTVIGTLVPTANPPVVILGGSTTITVVSTNVDRIDFVCAVASNLSSAGVFRQGSLSPGAATLTISPTENSGCRFTGYGAKLATPIVIDLPIVVTPPAAVVGQLDVKASPPAVAPGQSTTISAVMTNVTAVAYVCAAGNDLSGPVFQQGTLLPGAPSFVMTPSVTTTCKFTGTGPGLAAPVIRTLTVVVNKPDPVVGSLVVNASPSTITRGDSTFVSAQMTNVTSVAYSCAFGADGSGTVFLQGTLTPNDPSFAMSPSQTSTCTFTGTGPNLANPVIKSLTIVVNPPAPVVGSFDVAANPSTLVRGQSSVVTATSITNVTAISYSCSADVNGVVFAQGALSPASPSVQLAPTQNSTCVFTGTGPNLAAPVTRTVKFTVTDPPPVLVDGSFDVQASPPSVTRGQSTTVTATSITNLNSIAFACTYDSNGVTFAQGSLTAASPSFAMTPAETATCRFTGSGDNLAAPVVRAVNVVVTQPAPAQQWTWQGIIYQYCSENTFPYCDTIEVATCVGDACRAPRIQCYTAVPRGTPGYAVGSTQATEPTGYQCYLRQANEGWIIR